VDVALSGVSVADLGVTIDDWPDPVAGTGQLGYTITVHNAGPSPATNVVVAHTLPAGLSPAAMGGPDWTCGFAAGVVTCTLPSLAAGATAGPITVIVVAPGSSGALTSTVTVGADEADANAANDLATAETTVTGVELLDLGILVDDGGLNVSWGDPLTYTITVTNAGPSDVVGASVTDSFPAGLLNVTWTCVASGGSSCTASGAGGIDDDVDLLASGTATYTATGTVANGTAGPLQNTATVSEPAGYSDTNAGNDSSTDSTPVTPPADLIFYDGFETGDTGGWSSTVP
jgi:uncharacterized repeat protein (TIGR01451 family)